jgi:hypothetical protein
VFGTTGFLLTRLPRRDPSGLGGWGIGSRLHLHQQTNNASPAIIVHVGVLQAPQCSFAMTSGTNKERPQLRSSFGLSTAVTRAMSLGVSSVGGSYTVFSCCPIATCIARCTPKIHRSCRCPCVITDGQSCSRSVRSHDAKRLFELRKPKETAVRTRSAKSAASAVHNCGLQQCSRLCDLTRLRAETSVVLFCRERQERNATCREAT